MAQKKTRSKASAKSKRAGRGAGEIERYEKALDSFERALKTLYKGETEKARDQFAELKSGWAGESELMDRVNTFLAICESKLAPQRRPKTTEEMVTQAVMFMNSGDTQQAIKTLSKALEAEPSSPQIEYCLAAAHARTGDTAATIKHLKQAIAADPTNRIYARNDDDFDDVRDEDELASLIYDT
jgi:tetratricopeptide (TPR) repeat protein